MIQVLERYACRVLNIRDTLKKRGRFRLLLSSPFTTMMFLVSSSPAEPPRSSATRRDAKVLLQNFRNDAGAPTRQKTILDRLFPFTRARPSHFYFYFRIGSFSLSSSLVSNFGTVCNKQQHSDTHTTAVRAFIPCLINILIIAQDAVLTRRSFETRQGLR